MNYPTQIISDTIIDAVGSCLESMVFSETQPIPRDAEENFIPWETIPHLTASIDLGDIGRLILVLPNSLISKINEILGSNGKEEKELKKLAEDTVAELLNQVAGEFMTKLVGEDVVYKIGIPKVSDDPYEPSKYDPVVNFTINEDRMSATINLKEKL